MMMKMMGKPLVGGERVGDEAYDDDDDATIWPDEQRQRPRYPFSPARWPAAAGSSDTTARTADGHDAIDDRRH